jgi:signal transduction histidine kinase
MKNPHLKPYSYRIRRSFILQLFLFVILPLTVLLIVVAFGSVSLHHQAMRSLVGDRDLSTVRAATNSISQQLLHRSTTLLFMAQSFSNPDDLRAFIRKQNHLLDAFDQGVALFTLSGQLLVPSSAPGTWQNPNSFLTHLLDSLRSNDQAGFSDPWVPDGESKAIILVGALTQNGDALVGAFYPATLIQQAILGSVNPDQTTLLVVSPQSQILYQVGTSLETPSVFSHPGVAEALNGESGVNYFQSSQGEHVVAFSAVPPLGWGLIVEEAWEKIASPYLRSTQFTPFILVPILILAVLSLIFGIQQIVKPLQALEILASRLAEGDFKSIQKTVGGVTEIRNLQGALSSMAGNLNKAQKSLHHYIGRMTDAQEDEKRVIAREIHDETIQDLIALNQRIQLAKLRAKDAKLKAKLQELGDLTQESISDLRRIVSGLRPIYLEDFGLVPALEMLVNESSEKGSIPVAFHQSGSSKKRLKPEIELAFYRIAQEGLHNILLHSKAKQASLKIDFSKDKVKMSIHDDGIGFKVQKERTWFARKGHFGVLGIQERVELINARLEIISSPGNGTTIEVISKKD